MPVIVKYDSGFDTKLLKQDKLEALINEKGAPTYNATSAMWEWADGTQYRLTFKWPNEKRKIVGLETVPWTDSDQTLRAALSKPDPFTRRCCCHCRCYHYYS